MKPVTNIDDPRYVKAMSHPVRVRIMAMLQERKASPNELSQWDSMQHLMLVSGFEEEFGVDVDPEEAVDMYKDFATFKRVVLQKIGTRS